MPSILKKIVKVAVRHAVVGVLTAGHGNIALILNDINDANDCMDYMDAQDAYDAQQLRDVYDAQNAVTCANNAYSVYENGVHPFRHLPNS